MKNIHIALLAPYNVYPARTGGKKFIAFFYEYLARILPVHLISVADNDVPKRPEISFDGVLGSSKLRYGNPLLFSKVKRILKARKITDLIIVHAYFGWLVVMLKKSCKVRLYMLSHNIESVRFRSMGKWWWKMLWHYEKWVHQQLDHNFFVTAEDMAFAIEHYKLSPAKCDVITYGIEMDHAPSADERADAGKTLRQLHDIKESERILLFNGTLDYKPNIEAVEYILYNINPLLQTTSNFKYKIIICGKGLPASFNELKDYADKNIIYAGFVNDIDLYFKGADLFLNPVINGGGIKTKLVEALGNGLSAVSCSSGAFGVPVSLVPGQLSVTPDHDWNAFCFAVTTSHAGIETSNAFFNHFYWGNIAAKAAHIISEKVAGSL